jgi:hypothetical protein
LLYCRRRWIKYSTRLEPIGSTKKPTISLIPSVMISMYKYPNFPFSIFQLFIIRFIIHDFKNC